MAPKDNFETALRALEVAVERLESGELSLEDALGCFEQGVSSATRCQELLRQVETKVEVLLKDRQGNLTTVPFDEE